MDPATLVFAVLIFGAGLASGMVLGAVGLYMYIFAKGVKEYSARKAAYDEFVVGLEQEVENSKADMAAAENSSMSFIGEEPNA